MPLYSSKLFLHDVVSFTFDVEAASRADLWEMAECKVTLVEIV